MEATSSFGLSLLQNYSDNDEDSDSNSSVKQKDIADHNSDGKDNEQTIHSNNCMKDGTLGVNPLVQENLEVTPKESEMQTIDFSDGLLKNANFLHHHHTYRETSKINDSSDSESSSDESSVTVPHVDLNVSIEDEDDETNKKNAALNGKSKMLEDLGIFDLAPLEDLKISVPEEECIPIGVVHNIIDPLVIVSAKKGCPAIDLDSVLFLDHGKTILGQVFDVFGQISEPMYMVRFNSLQHITDLGVQIGMEVFFAPRTRHTAYVFVDALFKQKGSDASWEHDQEPPEGCLDYSDDEQERRAKAAHRLKKIQKNDSEDATANPCKKRQTKFRRPKGKNYVQQQTPVNPFYMVPPPGFLQSYPPPSVMNNPPTDFSTREQNAFVSPYIYPPPLQMAPIQNHQSHSTQNIPSQFGDGSGTTSNTSAPAQNNADSKPITFPNPLNNYGEN